MRHCVASYAHMASQGRYAVFKIEGKERATLGLTLGSAVDVDNPTGNRVPHAMIQQCYGHSNKTISDELRATLPDIVRMYNDTLRHGNKWIASGSNESPCAVVDYGW